MDAAQQAKHKLQVAKDAARHGHPRADAPGQGRALGRGAAALGSDAGGRVHGLGGALPARAALIDERGTLTFERGAPAHERAGPRAGAGGDRRRRRRRRSCAATTAGSSRRRSRCSKLGASALYLNTAFAGPQIADVTRARGPGGARSTTRSSPGSSARARGAASASSPGASPASEARSRPPSRRSSELIASGDDGRTGSRRPRRAACVILTSGTTGTPKGAARKQPDSLEPLAALFSKIPLKARETTVIAAPMFHSWGFGHFTLGLPLASHARAAPAVRPGGHAARGRPAPRERAGGRAGDAPADPRAAEETIARYDMHCAAGRSPLSGSALPGELATRAMDAFGDVLYNLYGSTEVGVGDDRHARGSARRARHRRQATAGDGREAAGRARATRCRPGEGGRIFVGNEMVFEGYTGGGGKEIVDGLMSTGDVGHFDARRAAVRRRPRRRDDRLRRRERVPARGRGPAGRPRAGRGGRGDRRRGRRSGASG